MSSRQPFFTPDAGQVRRRVERRAATVVVWLAGRSRLAAGALPLALFLALVFTPGAWALLPGLALLALVGLLSYLAWPVLGGGPRLGRLAVLALVAALVAVRATR